MRYEYNREKAAINFKKHGITFEQAEEALSDPHALENYDENHSTIEEERWQTIGRCQNGLVFVVTAERTAECIRIVSA